MSGGPACKCEERKRPITERAWVYLQYKCNYSAFNGYHYTPSDWSSVKCENCGAHWRTRANWSLREHP